MTDLGPFIHQACFSEVTAALVQLVAELQKSLYRNDFLRQVQQSHLQSETSYIIYTLPHRFRG